MGLRHFGDQPMPAQQPQLSSHRRHLPTLLPFVLGRCVESSSHIAIAKTIDGKLSSVDCCQQLSVSFPQRIECSIPLSLPPHRSTHLGCFLGQRALHFDRRQRRQMSIGGFAANFGSPTEISHTAPKHSPLFFTLWLILLSTPNSKVFRLVDRHLVAQHTPLVVKLNRVFVQPMLDPHSHTSTPPIRNHFDADPHSSRAPHIPHHLRGSKTQPFMNPVKIKIGAFAPLKTQLQSLSRSVPMHAPPPARLHATHNRYQSLLYSVPLLDLARLILLARTARGQIDHWPLLLLCLILSCLTNTTRQTDGELLEVFPHHPRFSEVVLHHRWIIQTPKRPLQPQSIPPVQ